ncbi:Hypothetical protein PHPALM_2547, partial [Phytophthora palmivora]
STGKEDPQRGSVPVFLPVFPPKIKSISHEALVKWKKDRREYETKLHNRCRLTGEDYEAVVEHIRDSFDADLLDTFCEFQLNIDSADVTEGMLLAEIDHIVGSVKNQALPDIKELFKRELKMNMTESDVTARVMDYFKNSKRIVDDNGLAECFSRERGAREKSEKDPKVLFRLIVEKATELERQYIRLKLLKRDTPRPEGKSKMKQVSR